MNRLSKILAGQKTGKSKNKFKAKSSNSWDSKAEGKYFNSVLKPLERAGKIRDLKRLIKGKDAINLYKQVNVTKNGKDHKLGKITFTPDFSFFNVNSNFFPYLPDGIFCYLEFKSEITAKKADYSIRKKLFLSQLEFGKAFIEIVNNSKNQKKVTVYLGRAVQDITKINNS